MGTQLNQLRREGTCETNSNPGPLRCSCSFFFTNLATVEPPVSDHPKCQDLEELVVAYESQTRGGLFREHVSHISLLEDNLSDTFSKYTNTNCVRLSLKVPRKL